MSSSSKRPFTWDVKKNKKLEAKKRKLEAFINLIEKEEIPVTKALKEDESVKESYKTLKKELQKYVKKTECNPSFSITEFGLKARLSFDFCNEEVTPSRIISPLFTEDIYHLLVKSVIGHVSPFPLRWCKLDKPQNIAKTVVIVIEELPKTVVTKYISEFSSFMNIFPYMIEIATGNVPFAMELSTMHLVSDVCARTKQVYSSLFPVEKTTDEASKSKSLSKLHLLLSPIQLVMEHYPLPETIYQYSKSSGYCFTKELYSPVSASSPMFALDCEMCMVFGGKHEVTRIAVVNEKLETVYHSFVKPKRQIVDYMTRYSGVTKELLADVKTTLSDVHKALQTILPSDAILCGQSLNFDLHALKMIHPYIIDTSVIFNVSGIRTHKTSLRKLSITHLRESIQDGKNGHSPVEDSVAAMKLVLLKLENNIKYGDAVLSQNIHSQESNTSENNKKSANHCPTEHERTIRKEDGFFHRLTNFSKKICLIGDKESLNNYAVDTLSESVVKIQKSNLMKVGNAISNNIPHFDLTIGHLAFKKDKIFSELNDIVRNTFDCCPSRTLFMVVTSDASEAKFEEIKNGLCMVVIKNES